jgi:hypothetical protein
MTDDNWLFWSLKLWGSLEAVNGGHPARVHKVQQRANDGDVRELRTERVSHGFTNHCMRWQVLKQIPLNSYPLCDIETYWRSLRGCGSMMFYDVLCLLIYWYSESSHLASKPTQHEEWVAHRRNTHTHTKCNSQPSSLLFHCSNCCESRSHRTTHVEHRRTGAVPRANTAIETVPNYTTANAESQSCKRLAPWEMTRETTHRIAAMRHAFVSPCCAFAHHHFPWAG